MRTGAKCFFFSFLCVRVKPVNIYTHILPAPRPLRCTAHYYLLQLFICLTVSLYLSVSSCLPSPLTLFPYAPLTIIRPSSRLPHSSSYRLPFPLSPPPRSIQQSGDHSQLCAAHKRHHFPKHRRGHRGVSFVHIIACNVLSLCLKGPAPRHGQLDFGDRVTVNTLTCTVIVYKLGAGVAFDQWLWEEGWSNGRRGRGCKRGSRGEERGRECQSSCFPFSLFEGQPAGNRRWTGPPTQIK